MGRSYIPITSSGIFIDKKRTTKKGSGLHMDFQFEELIYREFNSGIFGGSGWKVGKWFNLNGYEMGVLLQQIYTTPRGHC